jgi:hypothetical protein
LPCVNTYLQETAAGVKKDEVQKKVQAATANDTDDGDDEEVRLLRVRMRLGWRCVRSGRHLRVLSSGMLCRRVRNLMGCRKSTMLHT